MKKIGERVIRGKIDSDDIGTYKLPIFDGSFKTGAVITSFRIAPGGWATDSADCFAILSTLEDDDLNAFNPDFGVSSQIGWAANGTTVSEEITPEYSQIVRDVVLIEDIYIAVRGNVGTNYIIELDLYDLEPYQGSLAMVQNRSQG